MQQRVIYADILRILATIAVIIIHVSAVGFRELNPASFEWNVLNIYDSLVRWCVPVFVMLSGMFFLDPNKEIKVKGLYFKSISRILAALLVWAFIYELYKHAIRQNTLSFDFLYDTIIKIVQGNTHYHLWFLYMIIGIYVITPILRVFIKNATKRDIEYFLIIAFLFTSLIPTLGKFHPFSIFTPFISNFDINLVLGYVAYFVAGYYLSQFNLTKNIKCLIYALGISSVIFTVIATSMISLQEGSPDIFFYGYLRANIFFTSIALFLFAKESFSGRYYKQSTLKLISTLSKYSFGMFLVHDMMRTLLMKAGLNNLTFNPVLSIPIITICIFILSFIAAYFIRKIPYVGKRIT